MIGHSTPLARQPSLAEYAGTYQRPPLGKYEVRSDGEKLTVVPLNGNTSNLTSLTFYGQDIAYSTVGPGYVGTPYEFIRTPAGKVGWIRVQGRVAKKEG
jgi:hypothetical protein